MIHILFIHSSHNGQLGNFSLLVVTNTFLSYPLSSVPVTGSVNELIDIVCTVQFCIQNKEMIMETPTQ